jgi:predicted nucleotidyltransferase
MSSIIKEFKKDFSTIFKKYPSIRSAYLFGSTAQGADRQLSDVDIAIRLTDDILPEVSFDIRMQLMDDLENYFGRKVDIVVLNSASLKLIHQVLRTKQIIFGKDPVEEMDYAIQKQKEYFDFKYYIDKDIQESRKYFQEDHV